MITPKTSNIFLFLFSPDIPAKSSNKS